MRTSYHRNRNLTFQGSRGGFDDYLDLVNPDATRARPNPMRSVCNDYFYN
ncbi:MAG: hypothetical protein RIE73_09275 [Coleofasciculus sp. C1-SOL-03]